MSAAPLVTVLMAVHNGAPYVAEAIQSILAQTWRDFEFLILDDASTDATTEIVRGFDDPRIRLLQNERNLGLTASLNRGLREARGGLIARQDADDLSTPDRLAKQVAFLDANPGVALVGSQLRAIDAAGKYQGVRDFPLTAESVHWALLFANPIVHTAATFRRDLFRDKLGGYDERFSSCQDYELWVRAAARHRLCNLPERLVSYRMHAASISATRLEISRQLVREVTERVLRERDLRECFTEAEVSLLANFRWGTESRDAATMLGMIERLEPRLAPSPDRARTRAWIYAYLGYGLLPQNARAGLRAISRAMKIAPSYGVGLPWLKIAGLALLGDRARKLITALRR